MTEQRTSQAPAENPFLDKLNLVGRSEIFKLYQKVAGCENSHEAYTLLAEKSSTGIHYYDLVFGPYQVYGNAAVFEVVKALKIKGARALDLGGGTGLTALAIAPFCNSITVVDKNKALLEVAGQRLANLDLKSRTVAADVNNFTPEASAFDLIVAQGLDPYLGPSELVAMYQKIHKALETGGVHVKDLGHSSDRLVFQTSPTAKMAKQVVDKIGEIEKRNQERKPETEPSSSYQDLGFRTRHFKIRPPGVKRTSRPRDILVLVKSS